MDSKIKVLIDNLGASGEGVGKLDGFTIFVDGALPGEQVTAQLYKKEKRYAKGKLLSIYSPSPARVEPPCPVFERCGGCQLMHLDYSEQLRIKRQRVVDAFQRIGKIEAHIEPCLPSPSPLSYRNKIQVPVKEGKIGFYARSSNDLIDVPSCQIHCPLGEQIYREARKILQGATLKALIIKSALSTQEALIILVTKQDCTAWVKKLMQIPHVKGVVQNLNDREDNVVLGKDFVLLAGEGVITEILCGLRFKVSPASFFQVNPAQAERLYAKALEAAALNGTEVVLDAYCGVGTLSLMFAKQAAQVIGVECVPEAVQDAQENAEVNGIANVQFYHAATEDFLQREGKVDVLILNPPRKGCDPKVLEAVNRFHPSKVLYISCDPATLARDLALLKGYRIKGVHPFDMFPQTAHVETLAVLVED